MIYTYIFCWNEERILPFTLDHYEQFSDRIFLLDNYSTDKSVEIARKYDKVTVIPFSCQDEDTYDEYESANLRSTIYKDETYGFNATGKADWAILVDADELVYHPDIISVLKSYKEQGVGVPRLAGYEMVSDKFPAYKKGTFITQKVKTGSESISLSKPVIIAPDKVDVRFSVGAHFHSKAMGQVLPSVYPDIKLLHYKSLGKDYILDRYNQLSKRSSCTNKENQFGEHWYSKKCHKGMQEGFNDMLKGVEEVI